jgi:hypothetical protein
VQCEARGRSLLRSSEVTLSPDLAPVLLEEAVTARTREVHWHSGYPKDMDIDWKFKVVTLAETFSDDGDDPRPKVRMSPFGAFFPDLQLWLVIKYAIDNLGMSPHTIAILAGLHGARGTGCLGCKVSLASGAVISRADEDNLASASESGIVFLVPGVHVLNVPALFLAELWPSFKQAVVEPCVEALGDGQGTPGREYVARRSHGCSDHGCSLTAHAGIHRPSHSAVGSLSSEEEDVGFSTSLAKLHSILGAKQPLSAVGSLSSEEEDIDAAGEARPDPLGTMTYYSGFEKLPADIGHPPLTKVLAETHRLYSFLFLSMCFVERNDCLRESLPSGSAATVDLAPRVPVRSAWFVHRDQHERLSRGEPLTKAPVQFVALDTDPSASRQDFIALYDRLRAASRKVSSLTLHDRTPSLLAAV